VSAFPGSDRSLRRRLHRRDSPFQFNLKVDDGPVLVNLRKRGKILVVQTPQLCFFDPHAFKNPGKAGPTLLPQGDKIHERSQRARHQTCQAAELRPVYPRQEPVVLDRQWVKAEPAQGRNVIGNGLAPGRHA